MQMTKAASIAILAFTSSVLAYYPEAEYGSLYARDAYADAEAAEYDDFELYARDAEPEWDIHPRDAYLEGFEAGLYAREAAPPAAPKPNVPKTQNKVPVKNNKTPTKPGHQNKKPGKTDFAGREGRINKAEGKNMQQIKNDQGAIKKEDAEIKKLEAEEKQQNQQIGADQYKVGQENKAFDRVRQQQLQAGLTRRALLEFDDYDW